MLSAALKQTIAFIVLIILSLLVQGEKTVKIQGHAFLCDSASKSR
jgi:hypothetical protein